MSRKIPTILAIGIILILALAVGAGVWWYGEKNKLDNVDNNLQCNYNNPPKEYKYRDIDSCTKAFIVCEEGEKNFSDECGCGCETIDAVDTSDWKTYRNEKYGFEFRYPKKLANYGDYLLEVVDYGDGTYDDISKIKTHSLNLEIVDAPAEGFTIHISITSDSNILNYLKEEIIRSSKTNIINNDKYIAFSREGMGDPSGYIIQHNSRYYILEVTFDDGIFEKILSTFKFIN